jgi:hypothetical protein
MLGALATFVWREYVSKDSEAKVVREAPSMAEGAPSVLNQVPSAAKES